MKLSNKNKMISIILIIAIIFTLTKSVLAEDSENTINSNDTTNQSNMIDNNAIKTLSLQEQKNQVEENLAKANEKLTYVDGELTDSVTQIQKLEDKIASYQQQLNEVNQKYETLQQQVTQSEADLKTSQTDYDKREKLLKARLTEFYKRGTTTYLDVLLSSRDMIEFISNYFIIQQITEYDSRDLEILAQRKQEIEKITNQLKESKANMKLIKSQAETQTVILTNTKTILENYKNSLSDSEKEITSQITAYKNQQAELESMISNAITASTYELKYSGGVMIWPTLDTSYISSPFGSRLHPIQGIIKNHDGIDIAGKTGDPVYAAASGVIIYSAWMSGYGNTTMVDHGLSSNGVKIVTLYGHGNKLLKSVGDVVKQGDTIMEMGSTGNSTGPHVHFEVRENGVAVDPKSYLSSSTNLNMNENASTNNALISATE